MQLAPEVLLRNLQDFLTSRNREAWFTVFLATLLLLHQVAVVSQDRYRYIKQSCEGKSLVRITIGPLSTALLLMRSQDTRYGNRDYPLTCLVEKLHDGVAVLLAHWQYFKRCELMNFNWDDIGNSALMFLESHQVQFLKSIVERLKQRGERLASAGFGSPVTARLRSSSALTIVTALSIPSTPIEGCGEHELFWVSKIFLSEPLPGSDWAPPEGFTRHKPSVGRE